jgi:hypothetical protein
VRRLNNTLFQGQRVLSRLDRNITFNTDVIQPLQMTNNPAMQSAVTPIAQAVPYNEYSGKFLLKKNLLLIPSTYITTTSFRYKFRSYSYCCCCYRSAASSSQDHECSDSERCRAWPSHPSSSAKRHPCRCEFSFWFYCVPPIFLIICILSDHCPGKWLCRSTTVGSILAQFVA